MIKKNDSSIRKAYLKDFQVILSINHTHFGNDFMHLHNPIGTPERVKFNIEIGYKYTRPITKKDNIDSVFEYTFVARHLKSLEEEKHNCVIEFFLEDICKKILEDERVLYVKADLVRMDILKDGATIGVGIELHK